jgi:hypothetical protein
MRICSCWPERLGESMDDESKIKVIGRAIKGIGKHDGDDWTMQPHTHSAKLPDVGFEGLKSILDLKPIKLLIEEYETFDARALRAQATYLFREKARIWLFFIALAIGAFSLLPLNNLIGAGATKSATFFQYFAIFLAVILTIDNLWNNHFYAWRSARAKAELARAAFFREVLYAQLPSKTSDRELPLSLQKLEYVRRYHIELQYAYYLGRGTQHIEKEGEKRSWLILAGAMGLLTAIPLLVVGSELLIAQWNWLEVWLGSIPKYFNNLKGFADPSEVWFGKLFLALGTFAAGLEACITKVYRISTDLTNFLVYHGTAQRLAGLYTKHLRRLRGEATVENIDPVIRWFHCCNSLIMDEHKKWQRAQSHHLDRLVDVDELARRVA